MDKNTEELLTFIEDIKTDIPDDKYKNIIEKLQSIHESKEDDIITVIYTCLVPKIKFELDEITNRWRNKIVLKLRTQIEDISRDKFNEIKDNLKRCMISSDIYQEHNPDLFIIQSDGRVLNNCNGENYLIENTTYMINVEEI